MMPLQANTNPTGLASESHATSVYIARQPIFDINRRTAAYELLYRSGDDDTSNVTCPDSATAATLDRAANLVGLEVLTHGLPAFVNFTRNMLIDGSWQLLPPDRLVVELLEDIHPDTEVINACKAVKDAGYKLALDDYVFEESHTELLSLADIIKYDFQNPDSLAARRRAERYVNSDVTLLAEKVETHEEFSIARNSGYTLFQGRFFARPQTMRARGQNAATRGALQFLQELSQPEPSLKILESALRIEPGLSAKLLRYLNSAGMGIANRVQSLRQAFTLLGTNGMRRWGAIAIVGHLVKPETDEMVRICLARGRCCEMIGRDLPPTESETLETDLFLAGLLSGLPGLMGQPIEEVLQALAVHDQLFTALVSGSGQVGTVCLTAIACESGEWDVMQSMATSLGIDPEQVAASHAESILWADEMVGIHNAT